MVFGFLGLIAVFRLNCCCSYSSEPVHDLLPHQAFAAFSSGDKAFLHASACLPLPRSAGEGAPAGAGEGVVHHGKAAKITMRRQATENQ
jgi:hypothetical protein